MWKCSLSTYTGGDGEVESSGALCKKKDAKHEDRRRRERAVVFCLEKGEHMTEFEIDAALPTWAGGEDTHEERKRGECPYKGLEVLDHH